MMEDINSNKYIDHNSLLYDFSELKYMIERPGEFSPERIATLQKRPDVKEIYEFMKTL